MLTTSRLISSATRMAPPSGFGNRVLGLRLTARRSAGDRLPCSAFTSSSPVHSACPAPARTPRRDDPSRYPGAHAMRVHAPRYTDAVAMAPSLMESEVRSQPAILAGLGEDAAPLVAELGRVIARRRPHFAVLAARGSSDHAAIYGKYLLETQAGLVASLAAPSVYSLYGRSPDVRDALAIG